MAGGFERQRREKGSFSALRIGRMQKAPLLFFSSDEGHTSNGRCPRAKKREKKLWSTMHECCYYLSRCKIAITSGTNVPTQ